MKTRGRIVALVMLTWLGWGSFVQAKDIKIGYIDSQRILSEYQEAIDAQKILNEKNKDWENEALAMKEDLERLQEEIESQSLLLSEEKRIEKQQELQRLYFEYQQFTQDVWGPNGKYYQKNLELTKPIIDKINSIIRKIGEEDDFDYILDAATGNIVHARSDYDLTDRILEELNK